MKTAYIFLAEGFEESEAVNPIDILRRGKVDVKVISVTGNYLVSSSHGLTIQADALFEETDFSAGDMLVCPGGMPGTLNLDAHEPLRNLIVEYHKKGKIIAAICAAPLIFGKLGLLRGKKALCYPGFEKDLLGAEIQRGGVARDGNVITGKSAGNAMLFGLELLSALCGDALADEVANGIIMPKK